MNMLILEHANNTRPRVLTSAIQSASTISIVDVNLDELVPVHLKPIIPEINYLRVISNAIYHLENIDEDKLVISKLLKKCSNSLKKISGFMRCKGDKLNIFARSKYLDSHCLEDDFLVDIAKSLERELLLIMGPMKVAWTGKNRVKKFAYLAAIPRNDLKQKIDLYYNNQKEIIKYLRGRLGKPKLNIPFFPPYLIADVIATGGAADIYPKNFAHFLPEDEGKSYSAYKKTVIFSNLYQHRFYNTTVKIGQRLVDAFNIDSRDPDSCLSYLLTWMKGHDIGHFVVLPTTNYKALREVGFFYSMALQELIADCVGYLLSFPVYGLSQLNITTTVAKNIMLAEILRYLFKDNQESPDSYAALLELNFLVSNDYIKIIDNRISTTPLLLYKGFQALTRVMVETILKPDIALTKIFLNQYGNRADFNKDMNGFLVYGKHVLLGLPFEETYNSMEKQHDV